MASIEDPSKTMTPGREAFVVKIGGEVVGSGEAAVLARDLRDLGGKIAIVHGGGPQATELQKKLGLETRQVAGRRITDAATLDVMKMAVAGKLNVDLCAILTAAGLSPVGLHGASGLVSVSRPFPAAFSRALPSRLHASPASLSSWQAFGSFHSSQGQKQPF